MNLQLLKDYLENVYQIERRKTEINAIIKNLQLQKNIFVPKNKKDFLPSKIVWILFMGVLYVTCGFLGGGMMGTLIGYILDGFETKAVSSIIIPAFTCIGIVIALIIWLPLFIKEIKILHWNRNIASENFHIERSNKENTEYVTKKNILLDDAIQTLIDCGKKTEIILHGIYNNNFIHPKYRNYVAIATIYEYLDTGRCIKLEGPDGAYNLFEFESRIGKISSTLDESLLVQKQMLKALGEISNKLDNLKNNQYYLYSAMQESNREIHRLTDTIHKGVEKLDQIAVNTAVTSYTTQIIEKNQYYKHTWENTLKF